MEATTIIIHRVQWKRTNLRMQFTFRIEKYVTEEMEEFAKNSQRERKHSKLKEYKRKPKLKLLPRSTA
jgi:hypothetical protein